MLAVFIRPNFQTHNLPNWRERDYSVPDSYSVEDVVFLITEAIKHVTNQYKGEYIILDLIFQYCMLQQDYYIILLLLLYYYIIILLYYYIIIILSYYYIIILSYYYIIFTYFLSSDLDAEVGKNIYTILNLVTVSSDFPEEVIRNVFTVLTQLAGNPGGADCFAAVIISFYSLYTMKVLTHTKDFIIYHLAASLRARFAGRDLVLRIFVYLSANRYSSSLFTIPSPWA